MKKFTSIIKLQFEGNEIEAKNIEDYKVKLFELFLSEFNIKLNEFEIEEIEEIEQE